MNEFLSKDNVPEEKEQSVETAPAPSVTFEELLKDETVNRNLSKWYLNLLKKFGKRWFTVKDVSKLVTTSTDDLTFIFEMMTLKDQLLRRVYGAGATSVVKYKVLENKAEKLIHLKGELILAEDRVRVLKAAIERLEKDVS